MTNISFTLFFHPNSPRQSMIRSRLNVWGRLPCLHTRRFPRCSQHAGFFFWCSLEERLKTSPVEVKKKTSMRPIPRPSDVFNNFETEDDFSAKCKMFFNSKSHKYLFVSLTLKCMLLSVLSGLHQTWYFGSFGFMLHYNHFQTTKLKDWDIVL